jgi:hypothetical protein
MGLSEGKETIGAGLMVTEVLSTDEQPAAVVTTTVYIPAADKGTFCMDGLAPVAGVPKPGPVHEKLTPGGAVSALKASVPFSQTGDVLLGELLLNTGSGLTVTWVVAEGEVVAPTVCVTVYV